MSGIAYSKSSAGAEIKLLDSVGKALLYVAQSLVLSKVALMKYSTRFYASQSISVLVCSSH